MMQATSIFERNLDTQATIVCNRGGARSSKSWSICQLFLLRFLQEQNKKFLILRKTLPSLKLSILLLFKEIMNLWHCRFEEEKINLNYFFRNNFLHFGSLDDVEKIKSTEWNYIWLEEATDFTYEDFQILKMRLSAPTNTHNQIFMSFNPVDEYHWIKSKIIEGKEDVEEIKSNYHHNPFLSQEYIKILEQLNEQDQNFYRIYTLGEWGKLENMIYSNWHIMNDESIPEGEIIYGLDFGYNNPTALVKIISYDKDFYIQELLYEQKITNSELIEKMKSLDITNSDSIYADNAEPQRIEEIYQAGFNIQPAEKNVRDGIDFVKRHKLYLTRDSESVIKEIRGYSWKQDKNGNVLDEPVKYNDHTMDCLRYAIYTHHKNYAEPQVRWI